MQDFTTERTSTNGTVTKVVFDFILLNSLGIMQGIEQEVPNQQIQQELILLGNSPFSQEEGSSNLNFLNAQHGLTNINSTTYKSQQGKENQEANIIQEESKGLNNTHFCPVESCLKTFKYKWLLNRHLNSHFSINFYKCQKCVKTFKTEENLKLHILNIHENIKPYSCSYCSKRFSHRNGKNYHERTKHTNYLPYMCMYPNCNKKFANRTSMKYHEKSHFK